MKTTTYADIKQLAADLAGIPRDKLATSEAAMLLAFFAAELPDLWTREAWPELCDHLEAVTLDSNKCFSLREGEANEMGDILAVITNANPMTSNRATVLPRTHWVRLDERVNVLTDVDTVYVDWQTPAPDLTAVDSAALDAYELPERFKLPLAARGAALLVAEEDPTKAAALRLLADNELTKQAQRLKAPWWRN